VCPSSGDINRLSSLNVRQRQMIFAEVLFYKSSEDNRA
jgi:hypothetical protein